MELTAAKDTVKVTGSVFEAACDHPIDSDIILPDYCPDIGRILKTEADAFVDSTSVEAGRLTAEGTFCVRVIYIPVDSGGIRCVTNESPFSHSFDMGGDKGDVTVSCSVKVAFVTARQAGPRRVQVKAALSISAKAVAVHDEQFVSGCDDPDVQLRRVPLVASTLVGSAVRQFTAHEELEIGFGKPAAAYVIRSQATAVTQEYKVVAGKVVVKGELIVRTLYSSDEDPGGGNGESAGIETMENSIPLSQIIDIDCVDEDCSCCVSLSAGPVRSEPKSDEDGENRLLEVDMTVTASVTAWRTGQFFAVTDAFSPAYALRLETGDLDTEEMSDHIRSTEMIRQSAELGDTVIGSVTDCAVKAVITDTRAENGTLAISGDLALSLIASDADGSPLGIDKKVPFSLTEELHAAPDAVLRFEPRIDVVSAGFSLAGPNRVDLRVECAVDIVVFSAVKSGVVTDMSFDPDAPAPYSDSGALTLCYADGGEDVWDIAKRYGAPPDTIRQENGLESDNIERRTMLLIPGRRYSLSARPQTPGENI